MFLMISKKRALTTLVLVLALTAGIVWWASTGLRGEQSVLSWRMADKTIIIDPGHGGLFPGKVSADGVLEKDVNLAIAQKLQALLVESGSITVMTRSDDTDLVPPDAESSKLIQKQRADLGARTDLAAAKDADLFISIHCNSIPTDKWCGAQTFYAPDDAESAYLAQAIQQSLKKQLQNTDREALVRQDTFLFKHLEIPAVIVECGFLSNEAEAALLQDAAYQQKIAYAIFCGISDYLELTPTNQP